MNSYVLGIGILLIVSVLSKFLIDYNKIQLIVSQNQSRMDHDGCMDILNQTMKREFELKYKLEYELKDLTMLYSFQEDLIGLTQLILVSLSPTFMNELEFFYTRKYIISYVTRTIEIMLMEFIKAKKIKTM